MSDFSPRQAQDITLRPIVGIHRELPSRMAKPGQLWTAKDVLATGCGLKRVDGTVAVTPGETALYPPIQDIILFYKQDGTQKTLVVDQKYLYEITGGAFVPATWSYSTGAISDITGTTITFSGATINNLGLLEGDILVIDPATANEYCLISSITDATHLELQAAPATADPGAGTYTYRLDRVFHAVDPVIVDWVVAGNKVYFTDGTRDIYTWDGTSFTGVVTTTKGPSAIGYHGDRIWQGNTLESSVAYGQRTRWSGLGFANHNTFDAANYLDLPYKRGDIQKYLGLNADLLIYFKDAIAIGKRSNIPNTPYFFTMVSTGGIGLVGKRAVCEFLGNHFFIGQNNIYQYNGQQFDPIGTPIVTATIKDNKYLNYAIATPDPTQNRIVFGFPKASTAISQLWSYELTTHEWTYEDIECTALSSLAVFNPITWADLTDTGTGGVLPTDDWTGMAIYPSWGSILASDEIRPTLHYAASGTIFQITSTAEARDGTPIRALIESNDMDLDASNTNKGWIRLSGKFEEAIADDVSFVIDLSSNRGQVWKNVGTVIVPAGSDEFRVDFRMLGAMFRFRLTTTAVITAPWILSELVVRAVALGPQVQTRGEE